MNNIVEVVAALIGQDGKLLICRRPRNKSRALLWEFAGGKVEAGETGQAALIRECREELGITLDVGEIYTETTHTYPDITIHLTLFHARIAEGTPQALEHEELRWVLPQELPAFDFCPADHEIIARLVKESHESIHLS